MTPEPHSMDNHIGFCPHEHKCLELLQAEERARSLEEQLEALRELGRETSTFLFEWPLDGIYESEDEAKEDMRDLRVRWLHALGIPTPGVSNPASRSDDA